MKTDEMKKRWLLADDRIKNLWKKYPVVTMLVFMAGAVTGIVCLTVIQMLS